MIFTCKLQIFFCFLRKKYQIIFTVQVLISELSNQKTTVEEELLTFLKSNFGCTKKNKKQTINDEIQLYKNLKIEKIDYSVFWTDNELRLSKLRKFVKFVCFGPPISVPSERDFNMGTDIISSKRNSIFDKRVEFLTFLRRSIDRDFKREAFLSFN